jgi:UDP-N-acetylglucosamine transferase subunit ALG13
VVAQTCVNLARARTIEQHPFLAPGEFDRLAASAEVIVGHAGIGTIISADRLQRPFVLFPRRAALGEHRNDHQLATARGVMARDGFHVAFDEAELESLLTGPPLLSLRRRESPTRPTLVAAVRDFTWQGARLTCSATGCMIRTSA